MRWPKNYVGRFATVEGGVLGVCDFSGFTFNHKDLHKQMDWRGNQLTWTGYMVGTPFLDKPQEQNRPPAVEADPYPIDNPRYPTTNGAKTPETNDEIFNYAVEPAPGTQYIDGESLAAVSTQEALDQLRKVGFTNPNVK